MSVKLARSVWAPLAIGFAWVLLFGLMREVWFGAEGAVSAAASALVGCAIVAEAQYRRWWVAQFLKSESGILSPFGNKPVEEAVRLMVSVGNVTVAKSVEVMRRAEAWTHGMIVGSAILGTITWGYGDDFIRVLVGLLE